MNFTEIENRNLFMSNSKPETSELKIPRYATASVFPSFTRAHKKTLFAQTTTLFACYLHTTTITSKNNVTAFSQNF